MVVLKYPDHLLHKIDKVQLQDLMTECDMAKTGNISKLVFDLFTSINNEQDREKKKNNFSLYSNFFIKMLKHSDNREVLTFEIEYGEFSPLASSSRLFNHTNTNEDTFNFNKVLNPNYLTRQYKMLYRNLFLIEDPEDSEDPENLNDIHKIEFAFGRRVMYQHIDKDTGDLVNNPHFEYVWVEIDVEEKKLKVIISHNGVNHYSGQQTGSRGKIINDILPGLKSDYVFSINESVDEGRTLYLIYKNLTEKIEEEYYSKIDEDTKAEIKELVDKTRRKLRIQPQEDIGLSERIEKLFERNLIKKDFENFVKKNVDDGRVLNVGFTDAIGGSVRAKSGGKRISGDEEVSFDLQDSDIYFDIKETIKKQERLQSIVISWVNDDVIPDDERFKNILVKYTAFEGFYSTHFLKMNVREEIYDYVLPKFEEFKTREYC